MRVGIEVGGTFTDLVAVDGASVRTAKVPSTPARPDEGAMHAIDAAGLDPGAIEELVHGSTVATNAVLERRGAAGCRPPRWRETPSRRSSRAPRPVSSAQCEVSAAPGTAT